MKKKIAYSLMALLLTFIVNAQKLKVVSGNFDFLKDQKEINVVFDYSGVTFYKDNKSEEQYIQNREKEIKDKKGQNEADNWLKDWKYSKENSFPDKFLTSMNKYSGSPKINYSQNNAETKYTLIVKTNWIYPGWFGGVMKQPSKVTTTLNFIETSNPSNILLSISCENALGDVSFVGVANTNDRIAEGYAKTGKELAQLLNKKIK